MQSVLSSARRDQPLPTPLSPRMLMSRKIRKTPGHHFLEKQMDKEINPRDIAKLALLSESKQPVTKLWGEKGSPSKSFLLLTRRDGHQEV